MQSRACMPKTMLGGTCKLGASRTRWINRHQASQVCDMFRHGSGRAAADSSLLFLLIAFCSGSFRHRCAFGSISSPPLHSIPQSKTKTAGKPARKKAAREPAARVRPGNNTARLRHGAKPAIAREPSARAGQGISCQTGRLSLVPRPGPAGPGTLHGAETARTGGLS